IEPRAVVALDVEGTDGAQTLPGERPRQRLEALPVRPHRPLALVGLRPLHELVLGLVEAYVLSLPANAGRALEDLRALHGGNFARDSPDDALPYPHRVTRAMVHEVDPPVIAAQVDAVPASGHQLLLSSPISLEINRWSSARASSQEVFVASKTP